MYEYDNIWAKVKFSYEVEKLAAMEGQWSTHEMYLFNMIFAIINSKTLHFIFRPHFDWRL